MIEGLVVEGEFEMKETLKTLMDDYERACNMPTRPATIKKLPTHHIEDENQSVKWNREFVEQNNKNFQKTVSELQRKRNLEMNRVQKEIEKYISKESKTGEKGAKAIFNLAYQEGHSSGLYDVVIWIEQLIELVLDCKED